MPARKVFSLGKYDETTRSVEILASTPNPVEGEALVSWDLERFLKNPVILWAHDGSQLPLGTASDVKVGPEGLRMRVHFARPDVNPLAEQVACGVRDGVIRGVSVGFEPGAATVADGVTTRTANTLLEVSFVPIPKDEDAGTRELAAAPPPAQGEQRAKDAPSESEPETDEQRRARLSNAARELASGRRRMDAGAVLRFDEGGRLRKAKRTPIGGAYIPARLTRTGVLVYRNPDGSVRRELRHPDEVFHPDSLASLIDVPVVDIKHHTDLVTPDDWNAASLGHVKSVRRDGVFVDSELVVQAQSALSDIDSGGRTEISCGYVCKLDMTPGTWNGEPYDCVQRDIRYNHVALCPPNRGRAGPEVGLRLDEQHAWGVAHFDNEESTMKVIRIDGKDYEVGSDAHLAKIDEMHAAEKTALQKRVDAAEGRADAAEATAKKAGDELAAEKEKGEQSRKRAAEEAQAKFQRRLRIARQWLRFFGSDEEDEDEETEKKMDAMTERDMMLAVIRKDQADFKDEGRSDDYVQSRFDAAVEGAKRSRGVLSVSKAAEEQRRHLDSKDDADKDLATARKQRDEQAQNAWKGSAQNGAK